MLLIIKYKKKRKTVGIVDRIGDNIHYIHGFQHSVNGETVRVRFAGRPLTRRTTIALGVPLAGLWAKIRNPKLQKMARSRASLLYAQKC